MNEKQFESQWLDEVTAKRNALPNRSDLRAALDDNMLAAARNRIDQSTSQELRRAKWPMIYNLFVGRSIKQIRVLDQELDLVLGATSPDREFDVTAFLRTKITESPGKWHGGLFEVWSKAALLKQHIETWFDPVLSNGKRPDAKIQINEHTFNLEFTVLSEDDESREVFDRYSEAAASNPDIGPLIRPGKFCPPDAKGPSPYFDARRIYLKVYDKIARGLDPHNHQCADREPNIILISFIHPASALNPAVGWALDELFISQPRSDKPPADIPDITLTGWIDRTAKDYMARGLMSADFFCKNWNEMVRAPRRLGGVLLFDGVQLISSRVNYNSNPENKIAHQQMARVEEIFSYPCVYGL